MEAPKQLNFIETVGRKIGSTEDGKPIFQFSHPSYMQGHTFNMSISNSEEVGPFTIEYNFCSDFEIYNLAKGDSFSYLKVDDNFSKSKIDLIYSTGLDKKKCTIQFDRKKDQSIDVIRIVVDEPKVSDALRISTGLIETILDRISFNLVVPIRIKEISVSNKDLVPIELLRTIPYSATKKITTDILVASSSTSPIFLPLLSIYREALNSTSSQYKLLCLWKITEGLGKIKSKNQGIALSRKITIVREKHTLVEDDITTKFFPDFVGKSLWKFIQYVESKYRRDVAHLLEDDKGNLKKLAPKNDYMLDIVNSVLEYAVRILIQSEMEILKENQLDEPPLNVPDQVI